MFLGNLTFFIKDISRSIIGSKSILVAKRKTLKSRIVKSLLFAVATFFIISYFTATMSGNLSYLISIDPSIEYNETLRTIFGQVALGNNSVFGSIGVISLLSYIFFAPLVGTATLSLISEDESLSLSLPRGHKFFDSLFLNLFSGVGILQLLIGTGIVSIFSIEGKRLLPILIFGLIWITSGLLSTLLGWVRERSIQRIGFIKTLLIGFGLLLGLSLFFSLFLFTPFAEAYGNFIIWISKLTESVTIVFLFSSLILVILLSITFGHRLTQKVLFESFPREGKKVTQKSSPLSKSRNTFIQQFLLINLMIFRTRETRRTIFIILVLATLAIFFAPLDTNTLPGLVIGTIATFNLAWLANFYGLSGSGNVFLATKPKTYRTLPIAAFFYGTLIPMAFLLVILALGLILGNLDIETYTTYTLMAIVLAPMTALLASLLAIYKPYRSRLEGRGDVLIPPLTSLVYLAIFISLGVAISYMVSRMLFNYQSLLLSIFIALAIILVGRMVISYYWETDKTQYRIMKISSGD